MHVIMQEAAHLAGPMASQDDLLQQVKVLARRRAGVPEPDLWLGDPRERSHLFVHLIVWKDRLTTVVFDPAPHVLERLQAKERFLVLFVEFLTYLSDLQEGYTGTLLQSTPNAVVEAMQTDQGAGASVACPARPTNAAEWDALFDWFYAHAARRRMTVAELAKAIGYSTSYVAHKKAAYDAEHGTSIRKQHKKA